MKNNLPDIINDLLPRYCTGDATEAERSMVEEWIADSEENYQAAKQVYAIYLATDTINILKKADTEKALVRVKGKMTGRKKVSWWEWAQRIAAMLFIPVFIALMVQYLDKDNVMPAMLEVKTNPGITTSFVLSDGTVVYLNSASYLSYPSVFTGKTREVTLLGEAYFEVKKDKGSQFIVSGPQSTKVLVHGTKFNMEAYPADNEISTTLVDGSVAFAYKADDKWKKVMLEHGQKTIYDVNTKRVILKSTYVDSDIAWKDGKMIFRDTSFSDVLKTLGKRYNVEFVVKNPQIYEYAFTGTFEKQRLNRILEYFKISSNIKYRYITDGNGNIDEEKERIEIY